MVVIQWSHIKSVISWIAETFGINGIDASNKASIEAIADDCHADMMVAHRDFVMDVKWRRGLLDQGISVAQLVALEKSVREKYSIPPCLCGSAWVAGAGDGGLRVRCSSISCKHSKEWVDADKWCDSQQQGNSDVSGA